MGTYKKKPFLHASECPILKVYSVAGVFIPSKQKKDHTTTTNKDKRQQKWYKKD